MMFIDQMQHRFKEYIELLPWALAVGGWSTTFDSWSQLWALRWLYAGNNSCFGFQPLLVVHWLRNLCFLRYLRLSGLLLTLRYALPWPLTAELSRHRIFALRIDQSNNLAVVDLGLKAFEFMFLLRFCHVRLSMKSYLRSIVELHRWSRNESASFQVSVHRLEKVDWEEFKI